MTHAETRHSGAHRIRSMGTAALRSLMTVAGSTLIAGATFAQAYPSKPIEFVVPWPPGGISDGLHRIVNTKSGDLIGQQMVIINKAGAGGAVGTSYIANARPDGYTIGIGSIGNVVVAKAVNPKIAYEVKDFTPIANLVSFVNVVLVKADSPYNSLDKLLDYARKNPGKLNYGSAGNGTSQHLTGEMISEYTGVKMTHIPFQGGGPALNALMGGHVDLIMASYMDYAEQIRAGRVIALAATSQKRFKDLPQVPTFVESGYPQLVVEGWNGVVGPAGMPREAVEKVAGYFKAVLEMPDMRERLGKMGLTPAFMPPEEFGRFLKSETQRYRAIAIKANIRID